MTLSKLKIRIILFGVFALFSSCTQEIPDPEKAQVFIEDFMNKINAGNMENLSEYYSEEMNNGEDDAARIAKYKQLDLALGRTLSFHLLSSKSGNEPDSPAYVTFIFEVKHSKQTVIETYSVIKEGEKFKISSQNIVSKSAWTN